MTKTPVSFTYPEVLGAAHAVLESGNLAGAAAIFRSLPVSFPNKESIAAAATGLFACGLWAEAVALLEDSLTHTPSPGLVQILADAYAEKKQFAQAASCTEKFLDVAPTDFAIWASLGRFHAILENWADAERAFTGSLKLNPLNADAVLGLGDALYRLGRTNEALGAYRRAIALAPENAIAAFKLGSFLVAAEAFEEAECLLRRAVDLDPANAPAQVTYASALHQLGRRDEAAAAAGRAITLDGEFLPAYSILGAILMENGQCTAAAEVLRQGEKQAPQAVILLTALANAESAAGNVFAAEKILQRILSIEPGNPEARHMLSAVNGEPVRAVPAGYSREIFNRSAPKFDRVSAGAAKYRAPADTAALLAEAKPDLKAFDRFLDLGCGTGLVAEALAKTHAIGHRSGIDVAEKMIDVSRAKGIYDDLIHGDAAEVLAGANATFDLIAAVDLFTYVGDLAGIMPLIARALVPGGICVYSAEVMAEGKYKLQRNGRFAHSTKYIEDLARAAGLTPVALRSVTLRIENSAPVNGEIGLLARA